MKPKVMIISSVHRWDDTRIFHRQATSLAKKYDVELHAPADFDSKELNGVKIIGLPKWKKERDRVKLWWILFKRVFQSNADIVHFHDPELIPLGIVVKLFSKRKVIYDVHEHYVYNIMDKDWIPMYVRPFVRRVFILLESICVPKFDSIIYTTPKVGQRYFSITKRAISIENYPKKSTYETPSQKRDKNFVIYLGRVKRDRGIEEAILAFRKVIKKVPSATLNIVGDVTPERYENELKLLVKQLSLDGRIFFYGYVPHLKTLDFLKKAICGIVTFLPVKNHMSCLPNKLFEYMASGISVIASNFELYKQVVDNSKCGITVDPNNVEAIADAIIKICNDVDNAVRMGMNGREAFDKRYNWEIEEKKLWGLYAELFE